MWTPSSVTSPMHVQTLVVPTSRPPTIRRLATVSSLPPGPLSCCIPQRRWDSLQPKTGFPEFFRLLRSDHRRPGIANIDEAPPSCCQELKRNGDLAFQFRLVADQNLRARSGYQPQASFIVKPKLRHLPPCRDRQQRRRP